MATSVSSISGLASGIQWSDMIDQIMQNETTAQLTPISDKVTATQAKSTAWSGYRTSLQAFSDAAGIVKTDSGGAGLPAPEL